MPTKRTIRRQNADLRARNQVIAFQLNETSKERDSWKWAATRTMPNQGDALIERTRELQAARKTLRETEDQLSQTRRRVLRYRRAWQSARFRASAYGESILRLVEERETYAKWFEQEQAATASLRARLTTEVTG